MNVVGFFFSSSSSSIFRDIKADPALAPIHNLTVGEYPFLLIFGKPCNWFFKHPSLCFNFFEVNIKISVVAFYTNTWRPIGLEQNYYQRQINQYYGISGLHNSSVINTVMAPQQHISAFLEFAKIHIMDTRTMRKKYSVVWWRYQILDLEETRHHSSLGQQRPYSEPLWW